MKAMIRVRIEQKVIKYPSMKNLAWYPLGYRGGEFLVILISQ